MGRLVNAPNAERTIIFTSCGSESDNRAIDMAIYHYSTRVAQAQEQGQGQVCSDEKVMLLPLKREVNGRDFIYLL